MGTKVNRQTSEIVKPEHQHREVARQWLCNSLTLWIQAQARQTRASELWKQALAAQAEADAKWSEAEKAEKEREIYCPWFRYPSLAEFKPFAEKVKREAEAVRSTKHQQAMSLLPNFEELARRCEIKAERLEREAQEKEEQGRENVAIIKRHKAEKLLSEASTFWKVQAVFDGEEAEPTASPISDETVLNYFAELDDSAQKEVLNKIADVLKDTDAGDLLASTI